MSIKCQFITWRGILGLHQSVQLLCLSINHYYFVTRDPLIPEGSWHYIGSGYTFPVLSLTEVFWVLASGGVTGDRFPVDNFKIVVVVSLACEQAYL